MKYGELVTDYFSRTMIIANKMRIHGDKIADVTIIEKILRSMTTKFNYVKMIRQDKEEQALQASTSKRRGQGRGKGRGKGSNDGRHSNHKSEDSDSQARGKGHDNNNNHSMPSKSK
ncbi:uncharacterized protein LOC131147257 [Malania oleifera]|uniref:uncharacterized protein LOC131147257 n=1 Tax=Malania oleifera TaxID=397392 RepID=UPI0025AE14C4|nr:uncharacterized protein LOC131147257 [Malania oleifera]